MEQILSVGDTPLTDRIRKVVFDVLPNALSKKRAASDTFDVQVPLVGQYVACLWRPGWYRCNFAPETDNEGSRQMLAPRFISYKKKEMLSNPHTTICLSGPGWWFCLFRSQLLVCRMKTSLLISLPFFPTILLSSASLLALVNLLFFSFKISGHHVNTPLKIQTPCWEC